MLGTRQETLPDGGVFLLTRVAKLYVGTSSFVNAVKDNNLANPVQLNCQHITPALRKAAMRLVLKPSSRNISFVCCPNRVVQFLTRNGEPDILSMEPTCLTLPRTGWGISFIIPREIN